MANAGAPLSDLLADAVEAAGRSVVRVEARRRRPASGIVWSADGTIVAAEHAVQDEEHIRVALPDGREVPATLLGRDPSTDIAALRVDAPGLAAAEWRDVGALRVGHLVLALARPGRTVRARIGIVSALGQNWRTPHGGQLAHYLEPDVEPAPGFSGGPLVDVAGQVLGLNTAGLLRGTIVTVTAPTLRRVVDSLRAHGRIRRGYLGVAAHAVRLPLALAGQLQQNTGLLVIAVEPGAPPSGPACCSAIPSSRSTASRSRAWTISWGCWARTGSGPPSPFAFSAQVRCRTSRSSSASGGSRPERRGRLPADRTGPRGLAALPRSRGARAAGAG